MQHGAEHPDVALGMNNLGNVYRSMRQTELARSLYLRALAIRERLLGNDHPDVGTTLKNLAELYRDEGRDSAAQPLYQRAITILENAVGAGHPEVAETRASYVRLPAVRIAPAERPRDN